MAFSMNDIWKPLTLTALIAGTLYFWKKNKTLAIIFIILAILGGLAWFVETIWDDVKLTIYFKSVDLSGLNLADLQKVLSGETKVIRTTIGADIENNNRFSISFSNLKVKLMYENELIAETSEKIGSANYTVPAKGKLSIEDTADIILNPASVKLITQGLTNQKPTIDYTVNLKVWGIPLPTIKSDFPWEY